CGADRRAGGDTRQSRQLSPESGVGTGDDHGCAALLDPRSDGATVLCFDGRGEQEHTCWWQVGGVGGDRVTETAMVQDLGGVGGPVGLTAPGGGGPQGDGGRVVDG